MGSEGTTERTVVKTYVPAYQREEWDDHAEDLDMSRSEFVRTMVQAGRRGFEGDQRPPSPGEQRRDADESQVVPADLETTVVETLSNEEYLAWEELLAAVTDDLEQQLEEALQALQNDGRVRYSGRNGGYTLDG